MPSNKFTGMKADVHKNVMGQSLKNIQIILM
jgi:hypothetical protein